MIEAAGRDWVWHAKRTWVSLTNFIFSQYFSMVKVLFIFFPLLSALCWWLCVGGQFLCRPAGSSSRAAYITGCTCCWLYTDCNS